MRMVARISRKIEWEVDTRSYGQLKNFTFTLKNTNIVITLKFMLIVGVDLLLWGG